MGTDIADINNDGLEDIYVVIWPWKNLKDKNNYLRVNQNYDKFNLMVNFNLFYQYPSNSLQLVIPMVL
jgi:hypothetical protein